MSMLHVLQQRSSEDGSQPRAEERGLNTVLPNSSSVVDLYTCLSTSNKVHIPHALTLARKHLKVMKSLQKCVKYIIISPL